MLSHQCKADYQKNGETVRLNVIVTCATCTTRWSMARLHSRKDIVRSLTGHQFFLEHCLSTSQLPRKTIQKEMSLERKRKLEYSSDVLHAGDMMIEDYVNLQESEVSEIEAERFKSQEVFPKREHEFQCANGNLRNFYSPRPSLIAEEYLEPEDDVDIEEGDKKKKHRRFVVLEWRICLSTSWRISLGVLTFR